MSTAPEDSQSRGKRQAAQPQPAEERPPESISVPVNIGAAKPAEDSIPALPRNAVFAVLVATNPPGATVTLDDRPATACKSPCSVQAPPGRHRVSIAMPGYQTERREVTVTGTPQELPLVSLRGAGGTLMVTTVPPGASISINGNPAGSEKRRRR